ncbi:COX15/CtaA family protein [Candidatus Nitrosopelagicus sp.]|nr:COX15/CtaA family protein [Candidatus Nitrosopelagicus sp.]MDC0211404.1 COX15/CtaA family protein [Candidatus Nitrosopelagicus sp.]MDC0240850.1 COX15/CtaA family protein [Candidatus Nitrosopelagicus sp.]
MILKYLALTSLVILYSLMFVGGYISAAGLGLTCPEWPLCPNGVMPNDEYFIEWIHRTVAATTGLLILATTIGVWINKDAGRKVKFTSGFASALVVTQITLGALVIDTQLHAVLVAVHLGIGILLFAMTLLTVLFVFRLGKQVIETKV